VKIKGSEVFDSDKNVLKVNYYESKGLNHPTNCDDIRVLDTDFDSYIVSYSRNMNAMWIMTMPIPDNAMKNHILKRISGKLKESDDLTMIGHDTISNEEGKRPIADFVLDLGL
jgi:hypothetical protein